ncbi:hypothetical protein [Bosea sp. (in: a-proteobacteria)]|uniref:hypothetical protein n=1 Tax=Bosea sp. (in: a-proteobacteria) TaxID=1871050 RepID=UPI002737442A|nr:hypothetical protein [Bosea sp. (in: a-proteobacteria)]MDP3258909.1 hypothetical protein [Bosea sp. (in: a-proteobacteria)]
MSDFTALSHCLGRQVKRRKTSKAVPTTPMPRFRLHIAAPHCNDRLLFVRPEAERMAALALQIPVESSSRVSAFDEILSGLFQGSKGSAPGEAV